MTKVKVARATPHHVDVAVGKLVRAQRKMLKVSQTELGDRIGVTFQQVQKYENGSNRVSCSMLWEIAKALGISPVYFFEKIEASQSAELSEVSLDETFDLLRSKEGRDLAEALPKLSPKVRKKLASLAKTLANIEPEGEADAEADGDTKDLIQKAPAVTGVALRMVAA
jgi:transcriptional regulator with XRE-family HTH domain